MSAIMATQGGRVQLEKSHMRVALNMGKNVKEGFSRAAIVEIQLLINNHHTEVRKDKKWVVDLPANG